MPEFTDLFMFQTGRIAPGESTEEHEGLSKGEVEELIQEKEAKARAQILEMVSGVCGLSLFEMVELSFVRLVIYPMLK